MGFELTLSLCLYRTIALVQIETFLTFSVGPVRLICYFDGPCDFNGTFHLFDRILVFSKLSVEVGHSIRLFPYETYRRQ